MITRISGGRIVDPANGVDADGDLWVQGDRIIDPPSEPVADQEIDASGCVVMAGGIDLHTHIGGGKVTLARMLLQDQMPIESKTCEFLPSAHVTGQRYLDMGYTTCFEPAVIPCNARSAHAEMADVTGIDTGGYCLLGNDDVLLTLMSDQAPQALINDYVAWMVKATKCIAVKVVNPGGINAFKFGTRKFDLDSKHPQYGVTPAQVISVLCRAVYEIGLAHPLHVHCSNLGVPGNISSTLATIRAAEGLPIHLTHAQFHCYGDGENGMSSAAAQLVDAMNLHPNVTIDVGQIMFGQTVTISADTMHQYENFKFANPRKSVLLDIELEAGCGVVPFRYRRRQFVHSLQWAIGLELFLMIDDPSRVFLTTDHPNGGPFTAYPHLIRLLGDRSFRETALAEIHPDAAASSQLSGIDREYTLSGIAMMTRSAPASILGLSDRGHLAEGGVADIVVYESNENLEEMFAKPKYVLRGGKLVRGKGASDSNICGGRSHIADVSFDSGSVQRFRPTYEEHSAMSMDRLWIDDVEMHEILGVETVTHQPARSST